MSDIQRKRNDTTPITGVLRENGSTADLSQVSKVEFFMKLNPDDPAKAAGEAEIVDESGGEVRYQFSEDEVDESGLYAAEWQVTYADNTLQTFPNGDYLTVQIIDDLS